VAGSSLQNTIEDLCASFPGVAGVAARNLTTGERIGVNEETSFPTASMIKIMVLLELVRACARGQAQMWERMSLQNSDRTLGSGLIVDLDEGLGLTLRDLAVLMMSISDNTATNMLIDRLGKGAINQAIREAGMARTELRNKIDFELIKESNDNLAVTAPADFADFLAALRRGEIIPEPQVEQMLGIMRIQKYIEPMRKLLPFNPYGPEFGEIQDVWVASKTGSLKGARCEGGLVHARGTEWSLCVMSKDCPDNTWTSDNTGVRFISQVSRAVFDAWAPEAPPAEPPI
jgi:beta-lactamase class A